MIRKVAVTVRSAGDRIAFINKIFACSQIRFENNLAKAPRIMFYSDCRVGIGNLLIGRWLKLTLLLLLCNGTKSSLEKYNLLATYQATGHAPTPWAFLIVIDSNPLSTRSTHAPLCGAVLGKSDGLRRVPRSVRFSDGLCYFYNNCPKYDNSQVDSGHS
jgi:hypothetical protein